MERSGPRWCIACCTLILTIIGASPDVAAQSDPSRVAVGVSFSQQGPASDSSGASGSGRLGVMWRFGQSREGWGVRYGLNWYSAELSEELAGRQLDVGKLKVRPFMAGYGYTKYIGNAKLSANLMGGYAINSFSMGTFANDVYRQHLGVDSVATDVSNTFVVKPEVSVWLDVAEKIGLNIEAGYMIARPTVTMRTPLGEHQRHVNADMFMFKVGAVYSIF